MSWIMTESNLVQLMKSSVIEEGKYTIVPKMASWDILVPVTTYLNEALERNMCVPHS